MNKVSFTDKQLKVIETALEVLVRMRLGQFDMAIEEAFPELFFSWNESQNLKKEIRSIVFPEKANLVYDGHGGYYDQYGNTYDENRNLNSEIDLEIKEILKRAEKHSLHNGLNQSYGIGNEAIGEDAKIAYEIRQTLRQYRSVKENDGYFNSWNVCYDDALKLTQEPLPEIEGFVKEKVFPVYDEKINQQIFKEYAKLNWPKMWELIEANCEKPEDIESSRRRLNINEATGLWELIYEKPTRKNEKI